MQKLRLASLSGWALGCLVGCLDAPPPAPRPDAGSDAGPPAFHVEVHVEDRLGVAWPLDASPRWPRVVVELTTTPPEDSVFLFATEPTSALRDDLRARPVRAAHRDQIVAAQESPSRLAILEPPARLARGASLTVALGGWATPDDEPRLFELRVSEEPTAGAEPTDSWPPDGASGVSPSLAEVWIRFDGPLRDLSGLGLGGSEVVPTAASLVACEDVGWDGGVCARLRPDRPLAAARAHRIEVSESARDLTGAPVGPWTARFVTAAEPDEAPPAVSPLPCALDEIPLDGACGLLSDRWFEVRVAADEPVRARLAVRGRAVTRLAPRGEATLRLGALSPGQPVEGAIELVDLAGLRTDIAVAVTTPASLPPLSITEVRANPSGPEPAQEYVEVLNSGTVPVDLQGFSISDRLDAIGDVILQRAVVSPSERVLLVSDRFDPDGADDGPVPPGVRLVRVGASLASGGLTNAGEPVFLRDPALRRVSAAPAIAVDEGLCAGRRREADPRDGAPDAFERRPCRPGRP